MVIGTQKTCKLTYSEETYAKRFQPTKNINENLLITILQYIVTFNLRFSK
jgi:hypothetical protein